MTMYEPNPEVRPTGAEAEEFLDPSEADEGEEEGPVDPKARPSGSPPA